MACFVGIEVSPLKVNRNYDASCTEYLCKKMCAYLRGRITAGNTKKKPVWLNLRLFSSKLC